MCSTYYPEIVLCIMLVFLCRVFKSSCSSIWRRNMSWTKVTHEMEEQEGV